MPLRRKTDREPDLAPGDLDVSVDIDPEHEWRMRMLQQAGFTEFQSFRLSVSGADWHDCKRMLDAGCPAERVLDIVLE